MAEFEWNRRTYLIIKATKMIKGHSAIRLHSKWRVSAGATEGGIAPFKGTSFIVGLAIPRPVLLAGLDGPVQAGLGDLTAVADSPCLLDLETCGAGVANREEQLGVLFQAGSATSFLDSPARR